LRTSVQWKRLWTFRERDYRMHGYFKVSLLREVRARFWWGKPGRRRQVLRPKRRWKANIKMDFKN